MRIIEASSFVAAPSAGLYLSQFGAEVIRVDQIGGGPDFNRRPITPNGDSLYWESLNKGKKSVAIDIASPQGRELLQGLATAAGDDNGILLTNYPQSGFLSYENLVKMRKDQIIIRIMGQANGGPALDYTVNSAIGIPYVTGPAEFGEAPVNHVLPAWDFLTGSYSALSLMVAYLHRQKTKAGQEIKIPLGDIGITSIANLGMLGEVLLTGQNRPRYGNDVFGAFGRDFETKDKKRLMIVAISPRQWIGLLKCLNIENDVRKIEEEKGVSFAKDESIRFTYRELLNPLVARALLVCNFDQITAEFDKNGVCWGPYKTVLEAATDDEMVKNNPVFSEIMNPSGFKYPQPGSAATIDTMQRATPIAAPKLGQDTDWALSEILKMPSHEIAKLHDKRIVAGA